MSSKLDTRNSRKITSKPTWTQTRAPQYEKACIVRTILAPSEKEFTKLDSQTQDDLRELADHIYNESTNQIPAAPQQHPTRVADFENDSPINLIPAELMPKFEILLERQEKVGLTTLVREQDHIDLQKADQDAAAQHKEDDEEKFIKKIEEEAEIEAAEEEAATTAEIPSPQPSMLRDICSAFKKHHENNENKSISIEPKTTSELIEVNKIMPILASEDTTQVQDNNMSASPRFAIPTPNPNASD